MPDTKRDDDMTAEIARLEGALLHPFALDPPEPVVALEGVYNAFQNYAASGTFCEQCFSPENEKMVLCCGDLREKPPDEFSLIYFEHPSCSVGADGIMHFLPRALETLIIDCDFDEDIVEAAVKCGLYTLPEAKQSSLRQLFTRAAIGWFEKETPAPLGGLNPAAEQDNENVTSQITTALLHLRVRPRDLFSWLRDLNNARSWTCLCKLIVMSELFEPPYYFVVAQENEKLHAETCRALDRIARADLFVTVTPDALNDAWESVGMGDEGLYQLFRETDGYYSGVAYEQTQEQRLEDLQAIERLLATRAI